MCSLPSGLSKALIFIGNPLHKLMLSAPTCFIGNKNIPLRETVEVLRAEIRPPKKMLGHPNS